MAQNESVYVAGRTTEKGLIAIIRFSTDKWNIDDAGLAVLRNLTSNFRILLDTYRAQHTSAETFDGVILPALAQVKTPLAPGFLVLDLHARPRPLIPGLEVGTGLAALLLPATICLVLAAVSVTRTRRRRNQRELATVEAVPA